MRPHRVFQSHRGAKRVNFTARRGSVTQLAAKYGRSAAAAHRSREAATRGTEMHSDIYKWLNDCRAPEVSTLEFEAFLRWREARKSWHFVEGERAVLVRGVPGRYDAIFRDEHGRHILVDWKYGEFGDRSKVQAEFQLNLYKRMIRRPIDAMLIVNFKHGRYHEYVVETMSETVLAPYL